MSRPDISADTAVDPLDLQIGGRLRALRLERKVSQKTLGAALDVSFQQIQKYERGISRIPAGNLFKLAHALRSPVTAFFETEGENAPAVSADPVEQELLEAYQAINSPDLRRMVVRIVRDMGRTITNGASPSRDRRRPQDQP